MPQEIFDYLKDQRVGVLAVEMPDGSPHAATVHFAYSEEPFVLFYETKGESRKAEPIQAQAVTRATFVVGVDEKTPKTFQLDGQIELITSEEEKQYFYQVYLGRFPEKVEKLKDPQFIYFKFTPTWWRFSNFARPEGKLILTSK